ncbi:hypothetical protein AR457_04530 [Streptomyces agglomeratus]|uniref:Uncharacterized protein n=1 Tax=Streptomyces agglomeratus TaxID=285458 RepID=A0A1E5P2T6_9ACTN|nr:hypothetical protein [Streptomyces agglomeratus]OEJ23873.1 hypothetical protein AS594_04630 [Streptomyces agglomeratus]OEJ43472.1 hypothetical protein AR457_04530 [Streptomyces agglomeratus]OEJ54608.1 hypothetical protein BGK72_31240 [Streptomyces agglomeratus]OEJ61980.1 hypothetical protein BGM19_32145 [Streptomyces agglomeratus]
MADVVDADELLRRIRRARDWAAREEQHWSAHRSEASPAGDENGPRTAEILHSVYEAVRKVLDEVVDPGANEPAAGQTH